MSETKKSKDAGKPAGTSVAKPEELFMAKGMFFIEPDAPIPENIVKGAVGDLDVDADQIQWNTAGDALRGVLINHQIVEMVDKKTGELTHPHRYMMDVGAEKPVWFWGGYKLDRKLALVPLGREVVVHFVKSIDLDGGKSMKLFNVYTTNEQRIEAPREDMRQCASSAEIDAVKRAEAAGMVPKGTHLKLIEALPT